MALAVKVNSEAVPVGWLAGGRTDCGRAVVHGGRRRCGGRPWCPEEQFLPLARHAVSTLPELN